MYGFSEVDLIKAPVKSTPSKVSSSSSTPVKKKVPTTNQSSVPWTDKYRPKVPNDIIGNQSLVSNCICRVFFNFWNIFSLRNHGYLEHLFLFQVKQIHDWLTHWHGNFLHTGTKKKGKNQNDSGNKKAVLLCGTPGIGKTTSAKLVSQMLGFQIFEVKLYLFIIYPCF